MWLVMKPQHVVQGQSKETSGLSDVWQKNLEHRLFFSLPFQLWAVTLKEIEGSGLLDFVTGVTATILSFSIMGWLTRHQICWHQKGFTFLNGGRGSLLTS